MPAAIDLVRGRGTARGRIAQGGSKLAELYGALCAPSFCAYPFEARRALEDLAEDLTHQREDLF